MKDILKTLTVLETIINSPNEVIIFALDRNYRYLTFNKLHESVMKQIWGVEIEQGGCMLDYIKNNEDRIKAKNNFDRTLAGESFVLNEEYGDEKLKRKYYEDHYDPIVLDNGEVIGLTVFLTEITERIRKENELKELNEKLEKLVDLRTKELKESEEKYRNLVELSPDIIALHSEGKIIYVNDAGVKAFRASSPDDIIGKPTLDFVHEESKALALKRITELYAGKEYTPFVLEKFVRLDGTAFEAETTARRLMYENKPAVHVYIRDISERLEAERKLEGIHKIYRKAISSFKGVPYRLNFDNKSYSFIGEGSKELFGVAANQFSGKLLKSMIKEIQLPIEGGYNSIEELFLKFNSGQVAQFNAEYKIVTPDGKTKWISDDAVPINDDNGTVIGSLGILKDITNQKLAQLKVIESEQKFRLITEQSSDGIIIVDETFKIVEWNKAQEKITGYTEEEVIDKLLWDVNYWMLPERIKTPDFKKKIEMSFRNVMADKAPENFWGLREFTIKCKDGREKVIQTSNFKAKSSLGKLIGSITRDITAQAEIKKNLEKAKELAERSDKLKSEFLAQISHEIRTPINVMLSYSEFLNSEIEQKLSDEYQYVFNAIKSGGRRIIRTVDLILNFAEVQKGIYDYQPKKIDLYLGVLKGIFDEEKQIAINKGIEINLTNNSSKSKVFADEYSVSQIFINLIDNAIKYTSEGKVDIIIDDENDEKIKVSVVDTGIGISEEYLPKLFSPFTQEDFGYTRKYEGNGLGLALVNEYCKLNEAELKVESKKDEGSTFIVLFRREMK